MINKSHLLKLSLSVALLFTYQCSNSGFERLFSRTGGTNEADDTGETVTIEVADPNNPGSTISADQVTKIWTQGDDIISKINIVIVEDSSGSLDGERNEVASALESFLSSIGSQGINDVCVGVMLAHAGTKSGQFVNASGNPDCICNTDSNFLTVFDQNLKAVSNDNEPTEGEAGLYSFLQAITTKKAQNEASQCFRDEAPVIPFFLADENDISTSDNSKSSAKCISENQFTFIPPGPSAADDTECAEAKGRNKFHSNADGTLKNGAADVFAAYKSFSGTLPSIGVVIGYVNGAPSLGNEDEDPKGYDTFVSLSGGDEVDLALATAGNTAGFKAEFQNVGTLLGKKLVLQTVFDLGETALSDPAPKVLVDGNLVSSSFDGDKRVTISLADAGSAGSKIEITYVVAN